MMAQALALMICFLISLAGVSSGWAWVVVGCDPDDSSEVKIQSIH